MHDELLEAVALYLKEFRAEMLREQEHREAMARVSSDLWIEQQRGKLQEYREQSDDHNKFLQEIDRRLDQIDEKDEAISAKIASLEQIERDLLDTKKRLVQEWPLFRGDYEPGETYRLNEIVQRDGASWICRWETESDPKENAEPHAWSLLSMRGKRGSRGPAGDKGPPGPRGEPGKDGTQILDIQAANGRLAIVLNNGKTHLVDLAAALEGAT